MNIDPATNRPSGAGICYDPNGNLISLVTQCAPEYSYDIQNRLVRVASSSTGAGDQSAEVYLYTSDNKRVATVRPSGTTAEVFYIYGAKSELAAVCNTQLFGQAPTCGPADLKFVGRLIRQNGFPVTVDRLGSVVGGPNGAGFSFGQAPAKYYLPYGEQWNQTQSNTVFPRNFNFATYFNDQSTGLNDADQRFYNSLNGFSRFMSADPYKASAVPGDPGSWNRYSYAGNEPINNFDPTGLYPCGSISVQKGDVFSVTVFDCYLDAFGPNNPTSSQSGHSGSSPTKASLLASGDFRIPCLQLPLSPPDIAGDQIQQNIQEAQAFFNANYASDPESAVTSLLGFLTAKFQEGGAWDYKKNYAPGTPDRISAQNFGNFDFGAVLQSLDFSYYATQNAAGIAQVLICARGGACGSGVPGIKYPYGDQPGDAMYIQRGFSYEAAKRAVMDTGSQIFRAVLLVTRVSLLLSMLGCSVGNRHVQDDVLINRFENNEAEFRILVRDLQTDKNLRMISSTTAIYSGRMFQATNDFSQLENAGMTKIAWVSYQNHLRHLKLAQITKSESAIEFRVDQASISNGSSVKGYWYGQRPYSAFMKACLDNYPISEDSSDKAEGTLVVRKIGFDWYLFLFVNQGT